MDGGHLLLKVLGEGGVSVGSTRTAVVVFRLTVPCGEAAWWSGEQTASARGERDAHGSERVARVGVRPDPAMVMRFIDEHSGRFAVALLLRVPGIGESTYYA